MKISLISNEALIELSSKFWEGPHVHGQKSDSV